jgi:hypothetical protein
LSEIVDADFALDIGDVTHHLFKPAFTALPPARLARTGSYPEFATAAMSAAE